MNYYSAKIPLNNNINQINNSINKLVLDNPIGYCSYSDNDISDKISNDNNSDYGEYHKPHEEINSLKEKQIIKNSIIPTRYHIKFPKDKNVCKNNTTNSKITDKFNSTNSLSLNNFNNNILVGINSNNNDKPIIYKSNESYLNHYINRKNYSNNRNNKK